MNNRKKEKKKKEREKNVLHLDAYSQNLLRINALLISS